MLLDRVAGDTPPDHLHVCVCVCVCVCVGVSQMVLNATERAITKQECGN